MDAGLPLLRSVQGLVFTLSGTCVIVICPLHELVRDRGLHRGLR
jgi:hypothetical protein